MINTMIVNSLAITTNTIKKTLHTKVVSIHLIMSTRISNH